MEMGYRVVVVGATGNVGREMLNILAEREFPCDEIAAVASPRSQGTEIDFGETGKKLKVQNIDNFDFTGWDIALFAAGSGPTQIHAPRAASQGCVVIDNSSLYRMDPDVPLIVPEVNPDAIDGYTAKNIIANPNCSTAQMVVALKPLHDAAKIKRVVVSTYQSVSGAGKVDKTSVLAYIQWLQSAVAKNAVIKQNETDQRLGGHYGVPLMVYEGEPFFGQDRYDQLVWRMQQQGMKSR